MTRLLAFGALAATFVAAPALAQVPIANPAGAGRPIIVTTTDPITATYLGNTAAFTNLLYLIRPGQSDLFLFNNQRSGVGTTVDLGSFAIGTELRFRLDVTNTGDQWFSGSPLRNTDGAAHAAVENNFGMPGTTLVSFEDLPNSTDFNDLSFSFSGTAAGGVPEPTSWALMILGFGATGGALRVRRRRVAFA